MQIFPNGRESCLSIIWTGRSCPACYKGKLQSQVVPNHYDTVKTFTTFMPMTLNRDSTIDTQTPKQEVGLATGRTKLPGPDLLLHELERAAEKLEEGELQALEKERPGIRSHRHRGTRMFTQVGARLSAVLSYF